MSESEYIAATNLTKVRIAINVVFDILPGFDGVTTDQGQDCIIQILNGWRDGLEKVVDADGTGT